VHSIFPRKIQTAVVCTMNAPEEATAYLYQDTSVAASCCTMRCTFGNCEAFQAFNTYQFNDLPIYMSADSKPALLAAGKAKRVKKCFRKTANAPTAWDEARDRGAVVDGVRSYRRASAFERRRPCAASIHRVTGRGSKRDVERRQMKRAYAQIPEGQMHYRSRETVSRCCCFIRLWARRLNTPESSPSCPKAFAPSLRISWAREIPTLLRAYIRYRTTLVHCQLHELPGYQEGDRRGHHNGAMVATELAIASPHVVDGIVLSSIPLWETERGKAVIDPPASRPKWT